MLRWRSGVVDFGFGPTPDAHINSSGHLHAVSKKRPPGLRRRPPTLHHVFGDRRLGDFEPEHQQFAMDPGHNPERILSAHPSDEIAQLTIDLGRPALFRDFQRQNALKPERCHRKMVSGFATRDMSSRPGQIRVIHTNNARSLPYSRSRGGARLTAMLS